MWYRLSTSSRYHQGVRQILHEGETLYCVSGLYTGSFRVGQASGSPCPCRRLMTFAWAFLRSCSYYHGKIVGRPCCQWRQTEMTHCRGEIQLSHRSVMSAAAVWTLAKLTQQCTDVNMLNISAQSTHMLNELYDWQHLLDQLTCVQSENSFLHILRHRDIYTHAIKFAPP